MDDIVEKTFEQYSLTNYKNALKLGLFDFKTQEITEILLLKLVKNAQFSLEVY